MISGPADPKSSQAQPSWVVGPPVPPAARLGQLLDGEFLIKGILGQGELGVTYEADNTRLKRRFAVLMLGRGLKPTHGMMLAVRDDLRRAQQLTAAGIMPVKLIADRDGIPGFATELLEGETLRGRLGRGPLRAERALALVIGVARTLEAAHKVGMIHGDLRPENIFLVRPGAKSSFAGKAMIVEHALHHLRRRAPGLDDRLPLYKLMYRPPEQVLGEAGASEQGDVWVLGAILFECLTGKPAFYAEEPEFVLDNLGSPPPPLTQNLDIGLTEHLASALNVLIASTCTRDLDCRVPNMSELIEGLDQVVAGSGVKLPEVVVESREEAAAAPPAPTQPNRRMNRLLQRLSGVFPQIQLPGPASQPPGVLPNASGEVPAPASAAAASGPSVPAVVPTDGLSLPKVQAQLQPIVAPKERVSRILQALGPALQPTPPDGIEPTDDTPPPILKPVESAAKQSDLDRAMDILKKQREGAERPPAATAATAPRPAPGQPIQKPVSTSPAPGFRPTVPPLDPADLPIVAPAPVAPVVQAAPLAPVAPVAKPAEPSAKTPSPSTKTPSPAPVKHEAPLPSAKTPPLAKVEAPAPSTKTPPLGKIEAPLPSTKTPPLASTKTPPLASMKTPSPASTKTPPPASAKLPLLSSMATPVPLGQAVSTKNVEAKPEAPPSQKSPPAKTQEAPQPLKSPLPLSAQITMPPSAKSPAPHREEPAPSTKSPSKIEASAVSPKPITPEAPTVKPREVSLSSAETPKAALPASAEKKISDIALDSTLAPEDLAELLESSQPGMPVPSSAAPVVDKAADGDEVAAQPLPAVRTMSEIPTNPALAALVEKLSPIKPGMPGLNEQATQPALRRLPITDQATQARLDALPLNELATQAKLEALPVTDPSARLRADAMPLAELQTQAKYVPGSTEPNKSDAMPPTLMPPTIVAPGDAPTPPVTAAPPPMPPPAEKPRPPRPPRVSQLVAAIQAQSGAPPSPPAAPSPAPTPVAHEPVSAGRRSPGLIAPAPDILASSSPTVSATGTGANEVVLAHHSGKAGPVSWVLRHQEAVAALVGALLVILAAFLYIFLKS